MFAIFSRRPAPLVVMCCFCLLPLAACTPTTGTQVKLSQADRARLHNIGVAVDVKDGFSVRVAREELTNTGATVGRVAGAAGSLTGSLIETGIRSAHDQRLTDRLKPAVHGYDPAPIMQDGLCQHLRDTRSFETIVNTEPGKQSGTDGADGVLNVTIREWGVRRALGRSDLVQVGINSHAALVSPEQGKTIWARNDLYVDGESHSMAELESQPELVRQLLTRALDNLSAKIVNEICYP